MPTWLARMKQSLPSSLDKLTFHPPSRFPSLFLNSLESFSVLVLRQSYVVNCINPTSWLKWLTEQKNLKIPSKSAKSAARYNEFCCKYKRNKNLGLLRRHPFGSSRDEPLRTSAWEAIKTWALCDDITVHVKPVIQRYELEKREESFSQGAKSCGCDFVEQPAPYNCEHVCTGSIILRRNNYTTTGICNTAWYVHPIRTSKSKAHT